MNTPLMELIEIIDREALDNTGFYTPGEFEVMASVKKHATELLEKERWVMEIFGKKCIEIAVSNCSYDKAEGIIECDYSMATKEMSDYYTKTFTNESK